MMANSHSASVVTACAVCGVTPASADVVHRSAQELDGGIGVIDGAEDELARGDEV